MSRIRARLRFTTGQVGILVVLSVLNLATITVGIVAFTSRDVNETYSLLDQGYTIPPLPTQQTLLTPISPTATSQSINPAVPSIDIQPNTTKANINKITTNLPAATGIFIHPVESFSPVETLVFPDENGELKPTDQAILIGYSSAGRPIHIYRFGSGLLERLIVAGIHGGNEYNTVLLAEALIAYLEEHPEIIPPEITLYILPNLNPDGFARSWDIYGRANDHGVDLNHNFPFDWKADWNRDGCWRYLHLNGGNAPASEPEAKTLVNFLLTHNIDALISYHSAALGIFAGGDPPHAASQTLAEVISKVSPYPFPPIDSGCEMTGSLTDWSASNDIASVDIELTNHRDTDFWPNLAIISIFLNWRR